MTTTQLVINVGNAIGSRQKQAQANTSIHGFVISYKKEPNGWLKRPSLEKSTIISFRASLRFLNPVTVYCLPDYLWTLEQCGQTPVTRMILKRTRNGRQVPSQQAPSLWVQTPPLSHQQQVYCGDLIAGRMGGVPAKCMPQLTITNTKFELGLC